MQNNYPAKTMLVWNDLFNLIQEWVSVQIYTTVTPGSTEITNFPALACIFLQTNDIIYPGIYGLKTRQTAVTTYQHTSQILIHHMKYKIQQEARALVLSKTGTTWWQGYTQFNIHNE